MLPWVNIPIWFPLPLSHLILPKIYYISSNADRLDVLFLLLYHSTAYRSGVYPKFMIYHPTPIGATRAFHLLYINQLPTAWSGAYPKFIIYHPTPIDSTYFFFCYINQLPTGVECTQNLLYIIQRRSERLALFVCYISFNCLPEWSVPKIYDISSNTDRSDSRFSFVIYQSTAYCMEWSVPKIYYISSNADRSASRFSFVIYHSTAYQSGVYPKFMIYHPMPIGATRAFHLLYINQLPTAWSGAYPTFIIYHPTPIDSTQHAFSFVISFNCL
jgi:hypothetical protein